MAQTVKNTETVIGKESQAVREENIREKKAAPEKEITLEEAFSRLEELSLRLEDKDTPLEEAFELYKQGMDLVKYCGGKLDTVEKKMLQLEEDGSLHEF